MHLFGYGLFIASCFLAVRFGRLIFPSRPFIRLCLWTCGYSCIIGGAIGGAILGDFNFPLFLANPEQFLSPAAIIFIAVGVLLIIALSEPYYDDDDYDEGDDNEYDPWGPDFDEARAGWARQRPLVKS